MTETPDELRAAARWVRMDAHYSDDYSRYAAGLRRAADLEAEADRLEAQTGGAE